MHRCRILLVDDHVPVRNQLRRLLTQHDDMQIVGEASDGKQAIDLIESRQPDVVLLDINMPHMNGIEAAGRIKRMSPAVVILGLCGIQDAHTANALLKAGAVAVISKDRFDDLYATLHKACLATLFRCCDVWRRGQQP